MLVAIGVPVVVGASVVGTVLPCSRIVVVACGCVVFVTMVVVPNTSVLEVVVP